MNGKKPLSVVLALLLACNTTVMALANESDTELTNNDNTIIEPAGNGGDSDTVIDDTGDDSVADAGDIDDGNVADTGNTDNPSNADTGAKPAEGNESQPSDTGDNQQTPSGDDSNAETPTDDAEQPSNGGQVETPDDTQQPTQEPEQPAETPVEEPVVAPVEEEPTIVYEQNPDLPVIGKYTTADAEGNITIPESGQIDFRFPATVGDTELNSISASAFKGCQYFRTVTIPENITSIGDEAFAECENLQYIILEGRADAEDMSLGYNWSGDAEVIFELVAVEQPKEEEEQPVEKPDVTIPDQDDTQQGSETPSTDDTTASNTTTSDTTDNKDTDAEEPAPTETEQPSTTEPDTTEPDNSSDAASDDDDTDKETTSSDSNEDTQKEDADVPKQSEGVSEPQDESIG